MSMKLSPDAQAEYRKEPSYWLNLALRTCQVCRIRRSLTQFSKNPDICDRCFNRMPKS